MITIKRAAILDFQSRSKFVQTNTILPILSNLKLEFVEGHWQLVKNNLKSLCLGRIEASGEPATVLLNEALLYGLVNSSRAESITITVGDKITLSDGSQPVRLAVEDPAMFPPNPVVPTDALKIRINQRHTRALNIALGFTAARESKAGNFQYVNTSPLGIFGFHNNYFYINAAFTDLPELLLDRAEIELISASLFGVDLIDLPSSHVILFENYTYVFLKTEAKPLNITGVVDRLKLPGKNFRISKENFVSFCTIANLAADSELVNCLLEPVGVEDLKLSMTDKSYERYTERIISVALGAPDPFCFDSKLFEKPIASIPYETFEAKTNQNCLIISGSGGSGDGPGVEPNEWFCFIGLQK